MKTMCFIRSQSSINTVANADAEIIRCNVSVLVSDPDALITVTLTPDQIKTGAIQYLNSIVGKETELALQFVDNTFRNDRDRLVEFQAWRFFNLPIGFGASGASGATASPVAQKTEPAKFGDKA